MTLVGPLIQGKEQFMFDPPRFHRGGRQNEKEPVAFLQRPANLVVPLLRTNDVTRAVPVREFVVVKNASEAIDEPPVLGRM
jgi:hypothetical protein